MTPPRPLVSVVIPTCGRRELLRRCLAALERQSLARDRFEIVVVEDTKRDGPATARNRGWRKAAAPVVAFTDDDCVPDAEWLANGLRAIARADVVCGRIVMPLPAAPTDYQRDAQGLERSEFVTANCFCRKDMLERVGGFDERFRLAWREDSDLHFSLIEAGARFAQEPAALVVHPPREAGWGESLRQQRKVMFDALLVRKHPRLYRERIRPGPPWHYYAIVALALLGLAWPAAWIGWAAFTAAFCVKRLRGTSRRPGHVAEMIATSIALPPLALFWRVAGMLRFRVAYF